MLDPVFFCHTQPVFRVLYSSFQILLISSRLREGLIDYPFADFVDTVKGYGPVTSGKRLVKHLEKMQSQQNLSEDKVSTIRES